MSNNNNPPNRNQHGLHGAKNLRPSSGGSGASSGKSEQGRGNVQPVASSKGSPPQTPQSSSKK